MRFVGDEAERLQGLSASDTVWRTRGSDAALIYHFDVVLCSMLPMANVSTALREGSVV